MFGPTTASAPAETQLAAFRARDAYQRLSFTQRVVLSLFGGDYVRESRQALDLVTSGAAPQAPRVGVATAFYERHFGQN